MERALVEEFRIDRPCDGVVTAGRTDRGIADEIFGRYGLEDSEAERERFRDAYLERLPDSLSEAPGLLLPGVCELLEKLAGVEDVTLSLLTGNYAEGAWIKLRHYRLDGYFAFGGFGDHHADRDEMAKHAAKAATTQLKHPVDLGQACVVGDTPADIRCARAIGARVAAVATGIYSREQLLPHDPDHLFDDLSQTEDVSGRITGQIA
jgi:phosphoglycolate phosphatase